MENILVIDDDMDICHLLKRFLTKNKFNVEIAHSGQSGLTKFKKEKFDLVLCDYRLPDKEGIEMIKALKEINAACEIIIITGYSDIKMAVQVMKKGAFEYVTKPIHPDEILHSVKNALKKGKNAGQVEIPTKKASKKESAKVLNYVKGSGIQAQRLDKLINLVAPTDMTVVITGESGTGKEVTAQTLHALSKRKKEKIIAVDCGAIPKELAGSVLFGHVKGSFTGALTDKIGHFEAANKGTLFLDEIGNLSYENQIKLLRVLQERKIQKIGDSKDKEIDVRVIVATNEDLKAKVDKGEFREDLFYRLNEFSIDLPSLRERKDDIQELCDFMLKTAASELEKEMSGFDKKVLTAFEKYNWPGNIRELKNVIKRSTLMSTGKNIDINSIPVEIQSPELYAQHFSDDDSEVIDLKSVVEKAEKKAILKALRNTGFNKSKTAKILKVDRKTLYNKINAYNIDLPS